MTELPESHKLTTVINTVTMGNLCEYCSYPRRKSMLALTASSIVDQHNFEHMVIAVNMIPGYGHRFRENEPNRFGGWFQ